MTININEVENILGQLIGFKLVRSRNFCATRHFYFGSTGQNPREDWSVQAKNVALLALECPWRIESRNQIVTGSEDYGIRADDNADESWEAGTPAGHLQDQKLREFMGEMVEGDIIATGVELVVRSVKADEVGGFRLSCSGEFVLATFPSSTREMEWLLSGTPGRPAMLIGGRIEYATDRRGQR